MHEYPQEVKTVQCKNELSSCSLSYSKKPSACKQRYTQRRLMAVDPVEPEKVNIFLNKLPQNSIYFQLVCLEND